MNKVPQVTLLFWIIKVLATTFGETGGDAVSMTLQLGYAGGSLIFLGFFACALAAQVSSERYHPYLYWTVVVSTTTVGTTVSDFLDRTMGLGYILSSIGLLILVLSILLAWRATQGKIEYKNITTRKDEVFYWTTILVSNTLGTALGDFVADDAGLGFEYGALVFAGLIALVAVLNRFTEINTSVLFWAAYILTRPLGATVGDLLTKPPVEGGFGLGRIASSLVIAAAMTILIVGAHRKASPLSSEAPR